MRHAFAKLSFTLLLAGLPVRSAAAGSSENPPEGPPWKRDLLEAQKEALEKGKPIFLYFTKTY